MKQSTQLAILDKADIVATNVAEIAAITAVLVTEVGFTASSSFMSTWTELRAKRAAQRAAK